MLNSHIKFFFNSWAGGLSGIPLSVTATKLTKPQPYFITSQNKGCGEFEARFFKSELCQKFQKENIFLFVEKRNTIQTNN